MIVVIRRLPGNYLQTASVIDLKLAIIIYQGIEEMTFLIQNSYWQNSVIKIPFNLFHYKKLSQ